MRTPGRSARTTAAVVVVGALALLGCSSDSHGAKTKSSNTTQKTTDSKNQGSTSVESSTTASSTTTEARGPLGSGQTVTIAFAGDSSFQGLDGALAANPGSVLKAIAPALSSADLTMVNLEAAVGSGGSPQNKRFTFATPPAALTALAAAGVDVVTMANNHGMDYGPDRFATSLTLRTTGAIPIVGIGSNASEAYQPHIVEVKGQQIALFGANDVFDANLVSKWTATDSQPGIASTKDSHEQQLLDAVRKTRSEVDTLVVFLHYGTETQTCPNSRQVALAKSLFAAGADIVVGSHAHRLQGVGFVGDKLVAYGLGNFIFHPGSAVGRETGVLRVSVTGSRVDSFEWVPARINNGVPVPLTGAQADAEQTKMKNLASCAGVSPTPKNSDVTTSSTKATS